MQSLQSFLESEPSIPNKVSLEGNIYLKKNSYMPTLAYSIKTAQNGIFFRENGQYYQLKNTCKMTVEYDGIKLNKIKLLGSDGKELDIQVNDQKFLEQFYKQLTRHISHKDFMDQFKVCKRLGKGNFATVYLVQHKETKKRYAAKVFSKQGHKLQYKGKQSLENEIKILREIDHPSVVRYYGIYQTQSLIYILTEYLSGGTLEEKIWSRYNHSGDIIIKIFKDVLQGLAYLNSKNIMHRDIKPTNIMYRTEEQRWVISDFGLADFSDSDYLQYGQCGTMGYIAPQIMKCKPNQKYNQICDIYSFGVIAYTLIVGSLPFKLEVQNFYDRKLVMNMFSKQQCKGIPEDIKTFLKQLLDQDPKMRIKPEQALKLAIFNGKSIENTLKQYHEKKKKDYYDRILKVAN